MFTLPPRTSTPRASGLLGYFRPCVPVGRQELEARGIWDLDRLTQPYIRQSFVNEVFGKEADEVSESSMSLRVGRVR